MYRRVELGRRAWKKLLSHFLVLHLQWPFFNSEDGRYPDKLILDFLIAQFYKAYFYSSLFCKLYCGALKIPTARKTFLNGHFPSFFSVKR